MARDENNARFATLTMTTEECRAEARRYIKTLEAKADPPRCGARDDNVGINKNAGLRGRRFVSTTELTPE